jgi:nucleotide-binding universal stress UspA family protein
MQKPKRILVGFKDLEHTVELADMACRLGARNTSLTLVHVIELPDNTPLDAEVADLEAEGKKILRTAERIARGSKLKFTSRLLRAHSAGAALLDELKQQKCDLAVLGYHHGRTLGEVFLGTTATHLANHAPCHVLLSIPPRK